MTCEVCGHEQDRGRFCGRCGARARGAEGTGGLADATAVAGSPGRRPSRLLTLVVVALAGIGIVVAVLAGGRGADEVVASPQGPSEREVVRVSPAPSSSPSRGPTRGEAIFGERTGLVLLFDDGGAGALALDLDTGERQTTELPGQRAGDPPFRLWPVGGRLAVGWDEVHAIAPGTFLPPRRLGHGAVFLPAADPDQLWLIDLESPTEDQTWRLVDADGAVVAELPGLRGDEPVRGVPGGLAVRDEDGRLWRYDLRTRRVLLAAEPPAWIGDASPDRVVWCEGDPCRGLTLSGTDGTEVAVAGDGATFSPEEVWLAPMGERLAAVVMVDVDGGVDRRLRIYDVDDGTMVADAQAPLGTAHGAWSPGPEQFLAWVSLPGGGSGSPASLSRWADGAIEQVDIPALAGRTLGAFVPLLRHRAPGLVPSCPVSPTSREMGGLPAWRGEHAHVALSRSDADDAPGELWVGIPGADGEPVLTVAASRADSSAEAALRSGSGSDWHTALTVHSGMRTAAGFPPHWAFASRFPAGGCWVVSVLTEEIADTVTIDLG